MCSASVRVCVFVSTHECKYMRIHSRKMLINTLHATCNMHHSVKHIRANTPNCVQWGACMWPTHTSAYMFCASVFGHAHIDQSTSLVILCSWRSTGSRTHTSCIVWQICMLPEHVHVVYLGHHVIRSAETRLQIYTNIHISLVKKFEKLITKHQIRLVSLRLQDSGSKNHVCVSVRHDALQNTAHFWVQVPVIF